MTKAYLAGFIAGTMGDSWEHCPYNNSNGMQWCHSAVEWRKGMVDGHNIKNGRNDTGSEEIND